CSRPKTVSSVLPPLQGVWKPRKMMNPEHFEDPQPFRMTPFKALGLELWSMTSDIYFDNFIITSHKEVADRWASDSWGLKKLVASESHICCLFSSTGEEVKRGPLCCSSPPAQLYSLSDPYAPFPPLPPPVRSVG
ncbi:hypothetical protein GOODEAATRI_015902, partial [Goodea atripinnis]